MPEIMNQQELPLTLTAAGLAGTALSEDDFKKKKISFTTDVPRLEYAWDCGVAIGKYLESLKKGKLLGVRCNKCKRTVIPPRVFCEMCFRKMDAWVGLKDTGVVNTFSLSYVTWDMKKLIHPQMPAVIEIDGTSKTKGILHMLGEVNPKDVRIGMKVKAVWKSPREREGAITDIKYFKPL
jgi:uncharacterized OB-fold protein